MLGLAPDGSLVAYTSDETGRFEVYVDSFPVPGDRRQVSSDGGLAPAWSRDGRRLVFIGGDLTSAWSADVTPGKNPVIGRAARLGSFPGAAAGAFDPASARTLRLVPSQIGPGAITIVQNWLKK